MEQKIKEVYVQDPFIQHQFKELHEQKKVENITLKEGLHRWK
jgi:hypothetical protein